MTDAQIKAWAAVERSYAVLRACVLVLPDSPMNEAQVRALKGVVTRLDNGDELIKGGRNYAQAEEVPA